MTMAHIANDACCSIPMGIELTWAEAETFIDTERQRIALVRGDAARWAAMVVSVPGGTGLIAGEVSISPFAALTSLVDELTRRQEGVVQR